MKEDEIVMGVEELVAELIPGKLVQLYDRPFLTCCLSAFKNIAGADMKKRHFQALSIVCAFLPKMALFHVFVCSNF